MFGTMNCTYETPCGWCTKWDKKCNKKVGCNADKPHKDIVLEELFDITQSFAKCSKPRIKQIKVTTYFWNYLNNKFPPITLGKEPFTSSLGVRAEFTGIPVVVDDTIKHPFYEIVFDKEK